MQETNTVAAFSKVFYQGLSTIFSLSTQTKPTTFVCAKIENIIFRKVFA